MRTVHRVSALTALACVASFWSSTVFVELTGSPAQVAGVKHAIVYGLALLVPAMALTGWSGLRLARGRLDPGAAGKRRRMPLIAANGLLVLVPSAIYLDHLAASGAFGISFYSVQALELTAGAVNLHWMTANLQSGRRMARRRISPRDPMEG